MNEKEKKEADPKAGEKLLAVIAKIYLPLIAKAIEFKNRKIPKS